MSIKSRSARRSVRILGVVSASATLALGVSGIASACNIRDFKAEASCSGDKGQIVVTDTDASGTTAAVSIFEQTAGGETRVAGKNVQGSAQGTQVPFDVDWKASTTYRIHVKVEGRFKVDDDISPSLVTPAAACKKEESPAPSKPATPAPKPSGNASTSPAPSASASAAAPAGAPSNAPSPAAGNSNLAETGANSNTGLIAGSAAALVVVGGGAVYFGMRRRGANSGR